MKKKAKKKKRYKNNQGKDRVTVTTRTNVHHD